jgi:para-nitrobenzyl esterase
VTLFGQSAGAQNTSILVASKLTKGLLHKAIAESGTPMIGDKRLQSPAQTEQLGVILAGALKAPAKGAIQYLRGLPAAQLLAAMPEFRKGLAEQKLILDVGMDGYAVSEFSPAVYRSGKEAPIPMIIGSNGRDSPGYRPMGSTPEEIHSAMATRIGALYGSYPDLAAQVSKAYGVGGGGDEASTNAAYGPLDLQLAVDHGFRCEAVALAKWHSAVAPTWQYEFTAGNAAHPPAHSAELDFVFGYLRDQAADTKLATLSAQMRQYWTNFARTGDPNGPGLPPWAKHDAAARSYLDFSNEGPLSKANLRSAVCPLYVEKLTRDIAARQ